MCTCRLACGLHVFDFNKTVLHNDHNENLYLLAITGVEVSTGQFSMKYVDSRVQYFFCRISVTHLALHCTFVGNG